MTDIRFTHQNVLYHVFDMNLLSSRLDINLFNAVLDLQKPQIICRTGHYPINHPTRKKDFSSYRSIPDDFNTTIDTSYQKTFDSFNNAVITHPLLNEKPKVRQRKSYHSKKYLQHDPKPIENIDKICSEFIRPVTTYSQQQHDEQINSLTKDENISQNLNYNSESHQNIVISQPLTVSDLSDLITIPESEIIKTLFLKGIKVTINRVIGIDIATSVAQNYGFIVENHIQNIDKPLTHDVILPNLADTQSRNPVITILGDLSHGKTSLLYAIQRDIISAQKMDSMTQLIRAHETHILTENQKQKVIFLDTPGHLAFIKMRSLSVKIADIVILVIAADEGIGSTVMEIIQYIKETNLPLLIVINKIDKVDIEISQLKRNFLNHDIITQVSKNIIDIQCVSATTGQYIYLLSSTIITLIKKSNFKSDPSQNATGTIFNAFLDKNKGAIGHVLIQNGTLHIGDFIVAGSSFGKVRAIKNSQDINLESAAVSSIVEILGFSQVPSVGCIFTVVKNEKTAKKISKSFLTNNTVLSLQKQLNFRVTTKTCGSSKQINIILKTGTQGSIEAVLFILSTISQSKVQLNIISLSTGMITETDVKLAIMSKSLIIGFNTNVAIVAQTSAKKSGINIYEYELINDLLDGVKKHMTDLLEMENIENWIGTAIVRSVFTLAAGAIAGCTVEVGKVIHNSLIEISRNKLVIHKGKLKSLKHMKTDILEAKQGEEFGLSVIDFDSWQINDHIKFYSVQQSIQSL